MKGLDRLRPCSQADCKNHTVRGIAQNEHKAVIAVKLGKESTAKDNDDLFRKARCTMTSLVGKSSLSTAAPKMSEHLHRELRPLLST